ncbi:MAG: WG repeat-containing protein [Blautia sp.]
MKRNISLALIVLLALSWYTAVTSYFGTPEEYKQHLENAAQFEAKEIYEDAIAEIEAAQQLLDTRDYNLDMNIAHDYLLMKEEKDYVNRLEKIIDSYQENESAVLELTEYYIENNRIAKAVKLLQNQNENNPDSEEIENRLDELKGTYTTVFANYIEMSRIVNDSSVVKAEDGYGIINSRGEVLINSEYTAIGLFGDKIPYAPVNEEGEWFYVNSSVHKKLVPDKKYEYLGVFSEGKAVACYNGKYGYLDEEAAELCKFEYDIATNFYNEVAAVKKGDKWAIIDYKFKNVTDFEFDDVITDEFGFCSINKRIFVKKDGEYVLIDTKGKIVSELTYEDAFPFLEENQPAAVKQNGKWGFVDSDGELCIECKYQEAKSFTIDFAPVCVNDKWGYIDRNDKISISLEFSDATPFNESGAATVKREESWGIIRLNIYQ